MKTILIVGLGNPGKKFVKTRHNAGFLLMDYFFEKYRSEFGFSEWEEKKKLKSLVSTGKTNGKKIILLKPQTFMNLSGEAVSAAVKYFIRGETSNSLVVVHDEIDLPLGTFRVSKNASSAGHQGVQNIIDLLGTKNFTRIRIGVDNRKDPASSAGKKKIATEKYVLGKFTELEIKSLKKILLPMSHELRNHL
jgi:PTH1 family peptidyl-tRNA hydrolase